MLIRLVSFFIVVGCFFVNFLYAETLNLSNYFKSKYLGTSIDYYDLKGSFKRNREAYFMEKMTKFKKVGIVREVVIDEKGYFFTLEGGIRVAIDFLLKYDNLSYRGMSVNSKDYKDLHMQRLRVEEFFNATLAGISMIPGESGSKYEYMLDKQLSESVSSDYASKKNKFYEDLLYFDVKTKKMQKGSAYADAKGVFLDGGMPLDFLFRKEV